MISLKYCGSPTNFVNHLKAKHQSEYGEFLKEMGTPTQGIEVNDGNYEYNTNHKAGSQYILPNNYVDLVMKYEFLIFIFTC